MDVTAGLCVEFHGLPDERVVRSETVRPRGDLDRDCLPEEQLGDPDAVEREDDLPIADVPLRRPVDREQGGRKDGPVSEPGLGRRRVNRFDEFSGADCRHGIELAWPRRRFVELG
jgi:hypothetical protein